MSFPTVNGIDMETDDEINSSPTAIESGFRSGLASARIFRNEVVFEYVFAAGDDTMFFSGVFGGSLEVSVAYVRFVEAASRDGRAKPCNSALECHVVRVARGEVCR